MNDYLNNIIMVICIYYSNLDGIQNVCTSMNRGGIIPDHDYYNAVLVAFAKSGNLDAVNKVMFLL